MKHMDANFITGRLHNGKKDSQIIYIDDRDVPSCMQRIVCCYRCHTRSFLLSGDIHCDKSVVWRLRSKHHRPEYQWFSVVELEPAVRLSSRRSERHAGMEWHVFTVGPERNGDQHEL